MNVKDTEKQKVAEAVIAKWKIAYKKIKKNTQEKWIKRKQLPSLPA